jgi:hypothetical protein
VILTIDNPIAPPSDSEGLRPSSGNSKEGPKSGLFGQILISQEAVSPRVDEAVELLLPFGRETTGGTLLPGGGKQLPQVAGSESDAASLKLAASLPTSTAARFQATPADGGPLDNVEELISLSPDDLSQFEQNLDLDVKAGLPEPDQVVGTPKINEPALQPATALAPLVNVVSGGPEAAVANPIGVGLSNARDPVLPPQPPGQKFELATSGDKIALSRFGPVADGQPTIAQKSDFAVAAQDVSADSAESLKSFDGLLAKTVGANSPSGSAPLPLGIAQNMSETSLPLGAKGPALSPLSAAVGDPKWGEEFAGRIGILVDKGVSEAKLQLTPAELGRIEIKISTDGDQAKVLFTVQNATAREAIEQAMPRLREMLGQEGLQLAHSEVADHSATRDNDRNLNPEKLTQDTADLEEEIDDFFPRSVNVTADTMVDYYV